MNFLTTLWTLLSDSNLIPVSVAQQPTQAQHSSPTLTGDYFPPLLSQYKSQYKSDPRREKSNNETGGPWRHYFLPSALIRVLEESNRFIGNDQEPSP